ncbi:MULTISPECIES: YbaK/EbsC family protein [Vibrio]|uniref:YbaK/EbsC family protein n=2 Tax=Vibrio TaxID=662 RepID=A0A7X4LQI8_9VIBR|nr:MULTISPECIES: YbaK/EbsC family protein [Vibrio]MBF9003525.1 YbaK/EbsC family protein [Vibrio nitrifigilis]MZI96080.1 YbaK/EbsC family protein [Vibrio eleionomae]
MSVDRVKEFLAQHAKDLEVTELKESTATVVEAAQAFGVEPGQIAKTLSLRLEEGVALIVMAGDAKIQNGKFKRLFGIKPRMLKGEEVEPLTGFRPGGVCPFTTREGVKIFCDESLKAHDYVLPAGGNANSGVRVTPARLAEVCQADWVDVAKEMETESA